MISYIWQLKQIKIEKKKKSIATFHKKYDSYPIESAPISDLSNFTRNTKHWKYLTIELLALTINAIAKDFEVNF